MTDLKKTLSNNRSLLVAYCFSHIWILVSFAVTMQRIDWSNGINSIGCCILSITILAVGILIDKLSMNSYAVAIGIILCQFCQSYSLLGSFIGYGSLLGIVLFESGLVLDIKTRKFNLYETFIFIVSGIIGIIIAVLNTNNTIKIGTSALDWLLIISIVVVLACGLASNESLKSSNKRHDKSTIKNFYDIPISMFLVFVSSSAMKSFIGNYSVWFICTIPVVFIIQHIIMSKYKDKKFIDTLFWIIEIILVSITIPYEGILGFMAPILMSMTIYHMYNILRKSKLLQGGGVIVSITSVLIFISLWISYTLDVTLVNEVRIGSLIIIGVLAIIDVVKTR